MAKKIQPEVFLESGEPRNPHALLWASGKPCLLTQPGRGTGLDTKWGAQQPLPWDGDTAASPSAGMEPLTVPEHREHSLAWYQHQILLVGYSLYPGLPSRGKEGQCGWPHPNSRA